MHQPGVRIKWGFAGRPKKNMKSLFDNLFIRANTRFHKLVVIFLPVLLVLSGTGCATVSFNNGVTERLLEKPIPACTLTTGQSPGSPVAFSKKLDELLKMELISCPGGAIATLTDKPDDTGTVSIRCAGNTFRLFTSPHGTHCLPHPLKQLDRRVAMLAARAVAEIGAGNPKRALKLARKASQIQGNDSSEIVLVILSAAYSANRKFADAGKELSKALIINPGDFRLRLAHAVTLSEYGHKSAYAAEIAALYNEVPATDRLHFDLICRLADNENRLGNRKKAIEMARVACKNGVSICCDLAASDAEAVEVKRPEKDQIDHGSM